MRQLKYREVSWQAQKSMLKVVGLEFKCHWPIIRTRLWATKMFCFAQWEPQTWLLNWAIHLFFLSSVICKCKVESNFWELSYFLKYYYLQSFLPVLLNLWNLPSTKYIWFFPNFFFFFLLPWGYNNFLSHFYNFHIINHFFLVVGRKFWLLPSLSATSLSLQFSIFGVGQTLSSVFPNLTSFLLSLGDAT